MSFDIPCPEGWNLVKLSDLGEVNRGKSRHRPRDSAHLYGGQYPFIQTGDIKASGGRIHRFTQTYSEAGLAQSRLWPTDTMCITIAANIAETGILQFPACFPDSVIGFVADRSKCDVYFIEYMFRLLRKRIQAQATGSVQDNINLQTLERIRFPIPDLNKQKSISKFLKTFDDKILINSEVNFLLENIAQAIFKSWFVDFEPTKAKIAAREALLAENPAATPEQIATAEQQAAIQAIAGAGDIIPTEQLQTIAELFPNQLVESELGEMPEDWEVKSFGDVSTCFDSKRVPLSKKKREEKKPGDIPYYGATSVMDYVNEWIFDDIYLLLGEDGSVVKEDGSPFVQYIWGKSWVNNHAHVLQGKAGVSTEQLMLFMQSQNIASYVTGAVQLKLNQKNMNSIPFIDAGTALNNSFYQIVAPLYAAIRNNTDENEVLSQTRDILLPKLLSGEIELTNKEL